MPLAWTLTKDAQSTAAVKGADGQPVALPVTLAGSCVNSGDHSGDVTVSTRSWDRCNDLEGGTLILLAIGNTGLTDGQFRVVNGRPSPDSFCVYDPALGDTARCIPGTVNALRFTVTGDVKQVGFLLRVPPDWRSKEYHYRIGFQGALPGQASQNLTYDPKVINKAITGVEAFVLLLFTAVATAGAALLAKRLLRRRRRRQGPAPRA